MPQRNEMLSIYCIIFDILSLKLFKTIFVCFYILVEVNLFELIDFSKNVAKKKKSCVLVFENCL